MPRVPQRAFLPWIKVGLLNYYKHHAPAPAMRYFVPVFFRPGTYEADKQLHRKVTWPMKFGSPDWSLVPMPAKRMLKMEVQMVRTRISGHYSWLNASNEGKGLITSMHSHCALSFPRWPAGYLALLAWGTRYKVIFYEKTLVCKTSYSPSKKPFY